MYIVISIDNGCRVECGRYDSVSDFLYDYPKVNYVTVGHIIYITM